MHSLFEAWRSPLNSRSRANAMFKEREDRCADWFKQTIFFVSSTAKVQQTGCAQKLRDANATCSPLLVDRFFLEVMSNPTSLFTLCSDPCEHKRALFHETSARTRSRSLHQRSHSPILQPLTPLTTSPTPDTTNHRQASIQHGQQ